MIKTNGFSGNIYLSVICLLYFITAHSAFPQQSIPLTNQASAEFNAKLHMLITAARDNPRLQAAEAKVRASLSSITIRKALDPPQVGVEFYQAPVSAFPNPFRDQMEYDFSVQQMLPFPGKLGAMAGAQEKQTQMLQADRRTQELDIIRNIKSLFFEVYFKYRQMEINQETMKLVRSFVDIARKQYEVGRGKQSDILRAQTEIASLANDSIVLVQERKSMEGMVNALSARPVTAEIGFIPEIVPRISNYDLSPLLTLAEQNRPEFKSMGSGIEMAQAERLAARKELFPDFMIKGTYKQMVRAKDDWSLMVGATIPVAPWSMRKYSAGSMRADAAISEAHGELANMKNMIASEVNDALLKMESARERMRLSRETEIPQAQQTLESALAAYMTGKEDFLMLIDIQRMLVMTKLDYHMAVMTFLDSQSRLERAVGLSIDEIDTSFNRGNR
jgi:cobalt-zinc-cadmium efflux system outer membrane protein